MTVKQLRDYLGNLPDSLPVQLIHDGVISKYPEWEYGDGVLYLEGGAGYNKDVSGKVIPAVVDDCGESFIKKMAQARLTGFLLEYEDKDGNWTPSEFDCYEDANMWDLPKGSAEMEKAADDYFHGEISIGFFKALGKDVWMVSSCDWMSRLGVDFDGRVTPLHSADDCKEWSGNCIDESSSAYGAFQKWRVRKITISGEMSDKAQEFFRTHPNVKYRVGGYSTYR